VPADRRGLAFGLHRAFDNAGAVIGPLLAAGLLALQVPVRDILLWAAVPGALCVALALAIREPAAIERPTVRIPDWRWSALPPSYRRVLLVLAVFTLGQASNAFMLLRATELGMPATQVALLWAAVAATSTLLAVPLSAWSDRIGRLPLLIAGWSLHAFLFIALALVGSSGPLWFIAVLLGLYMAATEGAERALISDLVPATALGSAYGWYYMVKGLLLLPASAAFGVIWFAANAKTAFLAAAALVATATVLLAAWALPAVRAHR
jgi:MFS family permease